MVKSTAHSLPVLVVPTPAPIAKTGGLYRTTFQAAAGIPQIRAIPYIARRNGSKTALHRALLFGQSHGAIFMTVVRSGGLHPMVVAL